MSRQPASSPAAPAPPPPSDRPPDHYSYTVYADPATALHFDERRFGGPIGAMVAADQARVLLGAVQPAAGRQILDVGTGTGRAALLFAREGARVTGIDASDAMLAVARRRAENEGLRIRFERGDAHHLAFPDRAFDTVVSLRLLMHAPDWRTCLAELCRVAARCVVVDFPSAASGAALEAIARRIAFAMGAATEPYRVLRASEVARLLRRAGFEVQSMHRQFVLPIAIHRAIGSPRVSRASRALSRRLGLLRLFGSPVTIVAERCAS